MLEGFGLLICAPDERKLLRRLLGSLKRSKNLFIPHTDKGTHHVSIIYRGR